MAVRRDRVERVVEQIGPHLVELAPERVHPRQLRGDLHGDLRRLRLRLVRQDGDGVLEALGDVHHVRRLTIHVGVALDGRDQIVNPGCRGANLGRERPHGTVGGHRPHRGFETGRAERRLEAVEIGGGESGIRQCGRPAGVELVALQPLPERLFAIGALDGRQRHGGADGRFAAADRACSAPRPRGGRAERA